MELNGPVGIVYNFCNGFVRLAYLNLLWVLFTIIGLGIFGIMPATVAMFTVSRKWVIGERGVPIFKTFIKSYKEEFIRANVLGLLLFCFGYLMYQSFQLLALFEGVIFQFFSFIYLGILLVFKITLLYIFPVITHFDIKIVNVLKNAFLIGITHPIHSLMMIVGSILTIAVLWVIGLVPVFIGSLLSFVIMWLANKSFLRLDCRENVG